MTVLSTGRSGRLLILDSVETQDFSWKKKCKAELSHLEQEEEIDENKHVNKKKAFIG